MEERKIHTIDVTGKPLGRAAAAIAVLLRGKSKVGFVPYKDDGDFVEVENITKIKFTGKKIDQKKYFHHTGYLGNAKEKSLKNLFITNPDEVLRKAVLGMLPHNKLRQHMIKRLTFKK